VVGGILNDTQGMLWLSSQQGILRVNKVASEANEARVSPPFSCLSLSLGEGLASQKYSGSGQPVVT
jgi:hypothetical protein